MLPYYNKIALRKKWINKINAHKTVEGLKIGFQ